MIKSGKPFLKVSKTNSRRAATLAATYPHHYP